MPLNREHEIHSRRFGRNLGVGLVLAGFVALVFALTVVKVSQLDWHKDDSMQSRSTAPVSGGSQP